MDVLAKQKVAVAATKHSKLDLSCTHITTGNFMLARPAGYWHLIPKQSINGNMVDITRLAPVSVPTYGRARLNLRYFFVPYKTVFPNADELLTSAIGNNSDSSAIVTEVPQTNNYEFVRLFTSYITPFGLLSSHVQYDPNDPNDPNLPYDFEIGGVRYAFTYLGRNIYNILLSLGYKVIWSDDGKTERPVNILALLCYAKAFCDWYANSNYLDSAEYLQIQRWFKYNDPTSHLFLKDSDLFMLLGFCIFTCYDGQNEVFTNAWDNPAGPNQGLSNNNITIRDVTAYDSSLAPYVATFPNGTPTMLDMNQSGLLGTEFIHHALKVMQDAQKRFQLTGAAVIDRFLALYGVQLDSKAANRSIFVSTTSHDIDFGSVTSNANTAADGEPSNLGDYAGIGFGKSNDQFDFTADNFGMFIAIYSIQPSAGYYQGIDRHNLHIAPLDFWNPNYDGLSVAAISKGEVYVSKNDNFGSPDAYDGVFGYAPNYYEYKTKQNIVSGDFALSHQMVGGDSWHLFREFADSSFDGDAANIVHSWNFTRGMDATQYDRIFSSTSNDNDKFYIVFHFSVSSNAPVRSLFDSYDFEDEAKKITLQSSGSKLN